MDGEIDRCRERRARGGETRKGIELIEQKLAAVKLARRMQFQKCCFVFVTSVHTQSYQYACLRRRYHSQLAAVAAHSYQRSLAN